MRMPDLRSLVFPSSSKACGASAGPGVPVDLRAGPDHGRRPIGLEDLLRVSTADRSRGPRHGPDFILIGFSKCGTSTLANLLAAHPQIDFCRAKESNFFLWDLGQGWDWYEGLFSERSPDRLRGDGSVFYSAADWEAVASRWIGHYVPDTKFIWIARDPIKRLESSYREVHHSGHYFDVHAPYAISEVLESYPSFIRDTLYWQRLRHYLDRFPADNMHILFLEDLSRDPAGELERVWRFLGASADAKVRTTGDYKVNAGERKLYDSRVMRALRTSRRFGPLVRRLPPHVVDGMGAAVRLRIPFKKSVAWTPDHLQRTQDQLRDDARRFLEYAGKSVDFWPWVTADRAAA